jgi:hypothetical protein
MLETLKKTKNQVNEITSLLSKKGYRITLKAGDDVLIKVGKGVQPDILLKLIGVKHTNITNMRKLVKLGIFMFK